MVSDDHGYFLPTDDGLAPVPEASSPWSPDMLHGRLLAGLAARAVEQHPDVDPDLHLARLTVDMYRFPPMTPHQVTARVVRQGRRVGALDVSITADGNEVARASALLLRPGPAPASTAWRAPEWDVPGPDELPTLLPPDGSEPSPGEWEIRLVNPGGFWSDERKQVWSRDNRSLVAGEPLTPVVRAALSADLPTRSPTPAPKACRSSTPTSPSSWPARRGRTGSASRSQTTSRPTGWRSAPARSTTSTAPSAGRACARSPTR